MWKNIKFADETIFQKKRLQPLKKLLCKNWRAEKLPVVAGRFES